MPIHSPLITRLPMRYGVRFQPIKSASPCVSRLYSCPNYGYAMPYATPAVTSNFWRFMFCGSFSVSLSVARCVEVRLYPVSDASDRRRYECDSHDDNGDSDVPQRHCYWSCDGSSAVVRTVRRKSPKQTRRTTTEPATGRSSNVPS